MIIIIILVFRYCKVVSFEVVLCWYQLQLKLADGSAPNAEDVNKLVTMTVSTFHTDHTPIHKFDLTVTQSGIIPFTLSLPEKDSSSVSLMVWLHLYLRLFVGFPRFLESPGIFVGKFQDLESPGKWSWSWKVLEFARKWCLWQFLVSNRHVPAEETSCNCCHQVRFLGCRYAKTAFAAEPRTPLGKFTALPQIP